MKRRAFLLLPLAAATARATAEVLYGDVRPGRALVFPRDHGAHPEFRTEWWYLTGWLRDGAQREIGIQVTFFRHRPGVQETNASRFAPSQLLFAHAALSDPAHGRLRHDQRAARAGFGLAEAAPDTTGVRIDDWSLVLEADRYRARIFANGFAFDLAFTATQPVLLQGDEGYSRKGPQPPQASFYYSRPHLSVEGTVTVEGRRTSMHGTAWLDHEWSSAYLAPEAAGWDWIGVHFDDGAALMAFRIRHRDGSVLWAGGSLRDARGVRRVFAPAEIAFEPVRTWRSPRTGVPWPVAMRVRAGDLEFTLEPLLDDQELDSRASVGTIYWEGAVRATVAGRPMGRGYLELTGYWQPMKL
jgi:predicted secreted hydrolase